MILETKAVVSHTYQSTPDLKRQLLSGISKFTLEITNRIYHCASAVCHNSRK